MFEGDNDDSPAPASVPFESMAPKRGPEPTEVEFPAASVAAVEEAKEFAAHVVRPEPPESFDLVDVVVTKPAPESVVFDSELLRKVVLSPEIAAALAEEGLMIDQDAVSRDLEKLEQQGVEEIPLLAAEDVQAPSDPVELVDVTPEAFRALKAEINDSFSELASLVLEQQRQIDEIETRLTEHNKRGGHKI
jgi:hypothetical protein